MKLHSRLFILAMSFSVFTFLTLIITNIYTIRWDKIPVLGEWVLGIELAPADFDASYLTEPIEWQQLDEEPDDWDIRGCGRWFYFNHYTKKLLQNYMRNNNLAIVPGDFSGFKFRANFEECLETFQFVKLENPSPVPQTGRVSTVLIIVFGCIATICWIMLGIFQGKRHKSGDNSVTVGKPVDDTVET